MISVILEKALLVLLTAVLVFNMIQRRHLSHGEGKRFATLGFAGILLIITSGLFVINKLELPQFTVLPLLFLGALAAFLFRKRLFKFRFRCVECGNRLILTRTLYRDDNLCSDCVSSAAMPHSVKELDWDNWVPDEDAVLCFMYTDTEILLIHKKTGLGAGKINAPGGRIEKGESSLQAAIRESQEEVGITPIGPVKRADLSFQFTNGYSLHGSAFFAKDWSGNLIETDEAAPFWCPILDIPWAKMWEDDAFWLPQALEGKNITGRFIFDEDTMLSYDLADGLPT